MSWKERVAGAQAGLAAIAREADNEAAAERARLAQIEAAMPAAMAKVRARLAEAAAAFNATSETVQYVAEAGGKDSAVFTLLVGQMKSQMQVYARPDGLKIKVRSFERVLSSKPQLLAVESTVDEALDILAKELEVHVQHAMPEPPTLR